MGKPCGLGGWTPRLRVAALVTACGLVPAVAAITGPVATQSGLVQGVTTRDGGLSIFKGIPFAADTAGANRWRAPQAPAAWTGVRNATAYGNICPQSMGPPPGMGGAKAGRPANGAQAAPLPPSEDCLNLNVWTSASAGERRPVFVWIYGGRFSGGTGADRDFDGGALARKGLVVVTFNYRLGPLGFLASPELSRESGYQASGDYGLLDQIAALQWVKRNIVAFGGDPDHVTIAGQSAGAGSVLFLTDSPLAKGLFQRGIAESGARVPNDPAIHGLATSWRKLPDAENEGTQFLAKLSAADIAAARGLTWQAILQAGNMNDPNVAVTPGNMPPPLFRPVVDGWVLPHNYDGTWSHGLQNDVQIMTGNNKDESGASPQPHVKLTDYMADAKAAYGALAGEFLRLYPASNDAQAGQETNQAGRDQSRTSTWLFANLYAKSVKKPVYTYYWDHAPPGPGSATRGAYHGSEILYVFDNMKMTNTPFVAADFKIADIMSSYGVNFAKTGNPNGPGLPAWAASDPNHPATMELGDRFGAIPVAAPARIDFIERWFQVQEPW